MSELLERLNYWSGYGTLKNIATTVQHICNCRLPTDAFKCWKFRKNRAQNSTVRCKFM